MITSLQLIRNIGTFDSVATGAQLPLNKFALIYAENGRGKTTLASILRSLASGNPLPIIERRRLGSQHPPHVVIIDDAVQQTVFQNRAWINNVPDIVVFDDHFVTENVFSGMEVETEHRQKLHELIIGSQGVALNTELQGHIVQIERHNRNLQAKGNAILQNVRGDLSVDDFCALEERDDIDEFIHIAERNLAAGRQADAVRQRSRFEAISLPEINLADVEQVLVRQLPDLEAEAESRVQEHLRKIGEGGEVWLGEGMELIKGASADNEEDICPFCAQDLSGSPLITHYQAYFSDAYVELKAAIGASIEKVSAAHSGELQAAFERDVRTAEQSQQFWKSFADVPEVSIDTTAIALAWKEAIEGVLGLLQTKQSAPLDPVDIGEEIVEKLRKYDEVRREVDTLSEALLQTREQLDLVKEKAAAADVAALESDLKKLQAVKARYLQDIVSLCDDYLQEKQAKIATERLRDLARANLDQYREQIFPEYEVAINDYLQRFNAGFRLDSVRSVNTRSGSTCSYSVLINAQAVPLTARDAGEPSFKNTLSAGDRNALALAFFFASLENDPNRNQRIVVIDDPMTSLDEHRSLTTIQEIRRLFNDVAQLIVLSHSKPFLCDLWQGADTSHRSACRIARSNPGSTFAEWDVSQDCITEHDRRHVLVRSYIGNSVGVDERVVAAALRPILEAFARVAYPECFPPGALLGPFIVLCKQREGTHNEILARNDRIELRALLDYANLFHHDTNPAYQTVIINDHELLDFARRILAFAKRP